MQIIFTLCDRHYARGEQIEADAGTTLLKLNRREAETDLCVGCMEELTGLIEPFFKDGRRPGRSASPVPAPPPSRGKSAESDSPASPGYVRDEPNGPNGLFMCRWPDGKCDQKKPPGGYDTSQARGMHERRAHNFQGRLWEKEQQAKLVSA